LAATAAAAPQILDDPAHHLLSSMPLGRRRRAGHRLILFLPTLIVAWLLMGRLVVDRDGSEAVSVAHMVALTAIGLAGGCLAGRLRPELTAPVGTAIPLGIVTTRILLTNQVGQVDILDFWADHPLTTVVVGGLVCLAGMSESGLPRRRGGPG
jgi:peptidoglycan/LPS O-acetylase OafA/YrhL